MAHEIAASSRVIPAHPALAGIVQEVRVDDPNADKSPAPYRILPGLAAVIGFQYRGRLSVRRANEIEPLAISGLTGLQSQARWFLPQPETRNILIRFSPAGLYRLFGFSMSELAGRHVSMEQIVPRIRLLEEQVQNASPNQIHPIIENWLLSHLHTGPTVHGDLLAAIDRIIASAGRKRVESIADEIGVGKRQLERLFQTQIGVGPKEFASVARFNWILDNWHSRRSWCELAVDAGYSDQAHFIRSFRARTGVTPGEFGP